MIYMPKGSAQERVDAILNLGAECIVTDMNYDDTVRLTMQHAQQHGWEVVQDTAWEGYQSSLDHTQMLYGEDDRRANA